MNAGPAETQPLTGLPPATGWNWKKTFLVILFAFVAHLAFISLLGAKKNAALRPVKNVPVFHLADNASEFVRLTDPTLFARSHAEAFVPAGWARTPAVEALVFRQTNSLLFLTNDPAALGAAFNAFMQTNHFVTTVLNFKPPPPPLTLLTTSEPLLPQNSTWQLTGEIVGRQQLNSLNVPAPAVNDVLAPSRVQLLVDTDGNIVSAVLLDSSGDPSTDQTALTLARTVRFVPAAKLMFGEIIFYWHTVPTNAP